MDHQRTRREIGVSSGQQKEARQSLRLCELKLTAECHVIAGRAGKEGIVATATLLTPAQGWDTEKPSSALCQFADARRQKISRRDEEAALIRAAKNGDGHAFKVLIERYQRKILAVAQRFTRIREDAEDVVQQSLHQAFLHLHKFEGRSSFSTWLTRIAINEALMFLRRGRGLCEISIDDISVDEETPLRLEIPDSRLGPESALLQDERKRILSAAMNKLTPRTRKAIELRELGELSVEETAIVLGLSIAVVKGRLFHGRRKLRKVLLGSPLGNLVRSRQFNCVRKRRSYGIERKEEGQLEISHSSDSMSCGKY
jgi:RNA polymerase sigma-70 factor, ECF subfamily